MPVEIIPVDFAATHGKQLHLYYAYIQAKGSHQASDFHEFIRGKKLESTLELQWEFLIQKPASTADGHGIPIGTLTINNAYQQPEPIYFLQIDIKETELNDEVKECIKQWLISQKNIHGFDKIICYLSKTFIEQFLLELGGRTVNWLHFFELNLAKFDKKLLDAWDNEKLLKAHGLHMVFYDKIPEELMEDHAQLHTCLSNDIKRKDYSWSVVKTADYTRKRQKLLFLHGKKSELGYLFDRKRKLIGMTKIVLDQGKPNIISQTITGILPRYRGCGLAKLLKARMIKRVIKNHPAVEVIETDCLLGNDSMLFINEKLGFRRKNNQFEKEIIIDNLFLSTN